MFCPKAASTPLKLATLFSAAILFASAQGLGTSDPRPRFEVASIKLSRPDATMADMRVAFPKARMEAVNITVKDLLLALSGFSGKVEGGPKWVDSDRYDISAKADRDFTGAERAQLIMGLSGGTFQAPSAH